MQDIPTNTECLLVSPTLRALVFTALSLSIHQQLKVRY